MDSGGDVSLSPLPDSLKSPDSSVPNYSYRSSTILAPTALPNGAQPPLLAVPNHRGEPSCDSRKAVTAFSMFPRWTDQLAQGKWRKWQFQRLVKLFRKVPRQVDPALGLPFPVHAPTHDHGLQVANPYQMLCSQQQSLWTGNMLEKGVSGPLSAQQSGAQSQLSHDSSSGTASSDGIVGYLLPSCKINHAYSSSEATLLLAPIERAKPGTSTPELGSISQNTTTEYLPSTMRYATQSSVYLNAQSSPPSAFAQTTRKRKLLKRSKTTSTASQRMSISGDNFPATAGLGVQYGATCSHSTAQLDVDTHTNRRLLKRRTSVAASTRHADQSSPSRNLVFEPFEFSSSRIPPGESVDTILTTPKCDNYQGDATKINSRSILPSPSNRRWTVAVDSNVDGDNTTTYVERLRLVGASQMNETQVSVASSIGFSTCSDAGEWVMHTRALFVCSELLRTERSYLTKLGEMYDGKTLSPAPHNLKRYLLPVMCVSCKLLGIWEADPSMEGIIRAFMECADELEKAYRAWCGVIGDLFSGSIPKVLVRVRRARTITEADSRWGSNASLPSMVAHGTEISHIWEKKSNSLSRPSLRRRSVRDTGIEPTQRVTRYVLLFKELLHNTPPKAPAYNAVSQATQVAISIAKKCDSVQTHSSYSR